MSSLNNFPALPGPVEHHWSPYAMNGGTSLAIAGENFSVIASDTRLSQGFSIHTRDSPKTYRLSEDTVLACTGENNTD